MVVPASQDKPALWVQLGAGGSAQLRAVVEGQNPQCPQIPGIAMTPRAAATADHALVCSGDIPKGASTAAGIAVFSETPQRIVVLGDTGCRLKETAIQDCSNSAAWPFAALAQAAARLKPDLVIHVGDYVSRETPCPPGNAVCAGAPHGDSWAAWKADFFAPAAPLLAAAPFVFVRGNHEECVRMGLGFLRLLGPRPAPADCAAHLPPYRVPLGDVELLVLDDAGASDTGVNPALTPTYQADLVEAAKPSALPVWMLLHRPIWAAISGPLGIPIGGNAQVIAAAENTMVTDPVRLMLSGHIHAFQAINYARRTGPAPPPQIVTGNGGDGLHATPGNLKGAVFQGHSGVSVKDGVSVGGFGFLLMTRSSGGWTIDLYNAAGIAQGQCRLAGGRLDCPRLPNR